MLPLSDGVPALVRPSGLGNLQLALAILAVAGLNATIGFFQEYSAERTAEALKAMVPKISRVVREGERVEVPAAELIPLPSILLHAGRAYRPQPSQGRTPRLRTSSAAAASMINEKRRAVGFEPLDRGRPGFGVHPPAGYAFSRSCSPPPFRLLLTKSQGAALPGGGLGPCRSPSTARSENGFQSSERKVVIPG